MVTLRVVPEGLAAASAAVEALTARLAAAHAGAAPAITAVVAPAADPVSLQSAVGFSALGIPRARRCRCWLLIGVLGRWGLLGRLARSRLGSRRG